MPILKMAFPPTDLCPEEDFMSKSENQSQTPQKQKYIPVRRPNDLQSVDLLPVSEEFHKEYQREINRVRKAKQRAGQCCCPYRYLWKCDIDCDNCEYAIPAPDLSLEKEMEGEGGDTSNLLTYLASDSNPSDELEMAAFTESVQYLLDSMEERDRDIFLLHVEGLTQRKIADELGCSQGTVKNRLKEIITYLQGHLSDWQ